MRIQGIDGIFLVGGDEDVTIGRIITHFGISSQRFLSEGQVILAIKRHALKQGKYCIYEKNRQILTALLFMSFTFLSMASLIDLGTKGDTSPPNSASSLTDEEER